MAYGCRPEFGDVVEALNDGLRAFKKTDGYKALCDRYPSIDCDTAGQQWSNKDHPTTRADIVIGTEADWGEYNNIKNNVLGGFDIELTKEVCKAAGKTCAIVTVPWQAVWPNHFRDLGWENNPKTYPGIGTDNTWFHCSSGTRNTLARRQSTAFTDSYTDKTKDYAGFVVLKGSDIEASGVGTKVAILESQAYTSFFRQNNNGEGTSQFKVLGMNAMFRNTMEDVWGLLTEGAVPHCTGPQHAGHSSASHGTGCTAMGPLALVRGAW